MQRKCLTHGGGTERGAFPITHATRLPEPSLADACLPAHHRSAPPPAGNATERTFRRLVLPLPVGPMSAMTWFGTTAPVKPLRTSFAALSLPFGKTVYRNSRHVSALRWCQIVVPRLTNPLQRVKGARIGALHVHGSPRRRRNQSVPCACRLLGRHRRKVVVQTRAYRSGSWRKSVQVTQACLLKN